MPDDTPSSPPNHSTSPSAAIAYYKAQYEQLESELADFQASSRELEAELEKDVDASEKRERKLKEKLDKLGYEVDEWRTKYKQSKSEASAAQNTLQKEITTLRDGYRTLQLKLRDIEVANDDFERQARHTTSSLEDLESKYNVSIERAVLLEEEIRGGDQERESLRIENQRLRDELSDLKVETFIVQEKLRKVELSLRGRRKGYSPLDSSTYNSNPLDYSERSPATTAPSSPSVATPPTKPTSSVASGVATPPSPLFSESSIGPSKQVTTPSIPRSRLSTSELKFPQQSRTLSYSRRQSGINSPRASQSASSRRPPTSTNMPKSGSLYQIRGLIGKMQKLEERVQHARSRLPAPVETPPRISPRSGSTASQTYIPGSVTMRSTRKRSVASSRGGDVTPSHIPQSRNSFGKAQSTPTRPASRTSMSSRCSVSHSSSVIAPPRPESRQAVNRTPLGSYSSNAAESRRSRSSLSNYSQPTSNISYADETGTDITTPTPRHSGINGRDLSRTGIPTPAGLKKRQSNGSTSSTASGLPGPRRINSGMDHHKNDMPPPNRKSTVVDLGETY